MYIKSNKSTVHGIETPHGLGVPHRLPNSIKANDLLLLGLVSNLYPTGRAFNFADKKKLRLIHEAFNLSFIDVISDSLFTIDSIIADNENCTAEDCSFLEYEYGLVTNELLPVAQRRKNILNKMAFPNNIKERQSASYIQEVLNSYGFDVGIYENIFDDGNGNKIHKLPTDINTSSTNEDTQHGFPTQHGDSTQHGSGGFEVIANSMYDEMYSFGGVENLWATFFIAGKNGLNTIAEIPKYRKSEFRELVLKLKPANTIAFLFINFN